jgi:hypothetical protein
MIVTGRDAHDWVIGVRLDLTNPSAVDSTENAGQARRAG